jgi:hypothetical protein
MHSELHVQKRTAAAYDLFFYPIAAIALAYWNLIYLWDE